MRGAESRLAAIESVSGAFGMKVLRGQITACKCLLSEGAEVNVAVLGKFKAGKSSFLNCLAGRDVLPTGVVPVTAIVTELYGAASETASVKLLGGEVREIPLSEVPDYVNEERNPKNRRGAASVAIGLPALAEYEGARFVDTPGLDSALRHNTETSLDWLPNTGLALITISADSPLSEQDLALIEKTRAHSPEITLLLAKADRLTPGELVQLLGFVRGRLKEHFGRELPVYPFSIKPEFAALREEFREKVLKPFASGIGALRARIVEHKLGSLERQCRDYLLAAKTAARKSEEERGQLEALANAQRARFGTLRNDFKTILERNAGQCRSRLEAALLAHAPDVMRELKTVLRSKLSRPLNLLKMTRAYSAAMEEFFAGQTAALFQKEKPLLEKLALEGAASFTAMANDFTSRLAQEAGKALGARLPQSRWQPPPARLPLPDVRIGQAFDSHMELLWFLIPARLLRKRLLGHFESLVPFEAEKNLTSLAMGLADDINKTGRTAMLAALDYAQATLDTIERLLRSHPDTLKEIDSALAGLENPEPRAG